MTHRTRSSVIALLGVLALLAAACGGDEIAREVGTGGSITETEDAETNQLETDDNEEPADADDDVPEDSEPINDDNEELTGNDEQVTPDNDEDDEQLPEDAEVAGETVEQTNDTQQGTSETDAGDTSDTAATSSTNNDTSSSDSSNADNNAQDNNAGSTAAAPTAEEPAIGTVVIEDIEVDDPENITEAPTTPSGDEPGSGTPDFEDALAEQSVQTPCDSFTPTEFSDLVRTSASSAGLFGDLPPGLGDGSDLSFDVASSSETSCEWFSDTYIWFVGVSWEAADPTFVDTLLAGQDTFGSGYEAAISSDTSSQLVGGDLFVRISNLPPGNTTTSNDRPVTQDLTEAVGSELS